MIKPKISVIIPTHNPKYLKETIKSVQDQTFTNWEIVIVPNNKAVGEVLKKDFPDKRIRIVPLKEKTDAIGKIKKFAFSQGKGEWLFELDHDDILLPTALEELSKIGKEYDFTYSNTAEFEEGTWKSPKYNPAFGWQYREIDYQGHKLNEAISWEPTAASLRLIYYAPNHFRAWRKKFYKAIGGHNEDLPVCDDHELCIRTYLKGKMKHINKCLYLYRIYGENLWLRKNQEIQTRTHQLQSIYEHQLAERWANLKKLTKIDLGGRFGKPEGYLGVDLKDADIIANLEGRWPFNDNSVGVVRACDILEHLSDTRHTMSEIHRVLVPGGWLLSTTPSTDGRGAFQDPTHRSFWNENSFWYYTKKQIASYIDNKDIRFQVMQLKTVWPTPWHKQNNIPYVVANLVALKDLMVRQPGIVEI